MRGRPTAAGRSGNGRRGLIAAAAATAVLVAGCGKGGTTQPTAAQQVDLAGPAMSTGQLVSTLAQAGIATVADESARTPRVAVTGSTALTVTNWQASNLAAETRSHAGITGADLNAVLPMPGAPTLSDLIGAWVSADADPAERAAARILGQRDWRDSDDVVFPTAVLDLFVADAVSHAIGPAAAASSSPQPSGTARSGAGSAATGPAHLAVGDAAFGTTAVAGARVDTSLAAAPCSTIANFVASVLDRIFSALKLDPAAVAAYVSGAVGGGLLGAVAGGFAGWVASFWNRAVSAAQAAAEQVLASLTQPVLNLLRLVLGGLATISMVVSYLKRWDATVAPSPAENRFAIGSEPDRTGTFTAHVDPHAETDYWPPELVDCAVAAGVTLPTLTKAGLPVTWRVLGDEPGLVGITAPAGSPPTGVLDADLSDGLSYVTGRESVAQAKKGVLVTPTVTATASVRRTEVDELRKFVTAFATAQIPRVLAPVVNPIIASYIELATKQLDRITAVDGSVTIVVSHHEPKPQPTSPAPASCTGSGPGIPAGTYAGPITATIKTHMTLGSIANAGGGSEALTGKVSITSTGATVTGTISLAGKGTSEVGLPTSEKVHSVDRGSFAGTISGAATSPVVSGTLGGAWKSLDAPVINGKGSASRHVHAGLHVIKASCASVTGNAVAMFADFAAPVAQYLSIGGSGTWIATRT